MNNSREQQGNMARIWIGESCDEVSLSPVEGWTELIRWETHTALLAEAVREAEEKGFHRGLMHKSVPRGMVSVHGTDDCFNCETGRITLYAASRYCTECEHKAAST